VCDIKYGYGKIVIQLPEPDTEKGNRDGGAFERRRRG